MRTPRPLLAPVALATLLALANTSALAQRVAQTTPSSVQIDIAVLPLAQSLNELARQTNLQISFPADQVAGRTAPAVSGKLTLRQALDRLLAGSGLQADVSGSTIIVTAGQQVTMLSTVKVVGGIDPVVARVNPPLTIGSKEPIAQREIPNSVTVVTQQQIQSQNATTIDDAMRSVPGVTVNQFENGLTAYYSRGFAIRTFQIDGVPTSIPSSAGGMGADDLIAYDRVEVLRGPAGLFNGMGTDGGIINLVRKRAPSQFEASTDLSVGTYADHREQLDLGGPLNESGTLRGRLVAMQHDQHLMQEGSWQRDQAVYGTLEADLTPSTLARVGFSYSHVSGHVPYGWPNTTDDSPLYPSRSKYIGAPWDHEDIQTTNAFAELDHDFGDGWKGKFAYNHRDYFIHKKNGIPGSYVDTSDDDTADLYSNNAKDSNSQDSIDLYATGPFELFGRTHHLTVGANYAHQNDHVTQSFINTDTGLDYWGDVYTNVYDNSAYSDAFAGGGGEDYRTTTYQYGMYANTRISMTDPLTLILGSRVSWWHSKLTPNADDYWNQNGDSKEDDQIGPKVTPFAGLVYGINKNYSIYTSYTSIFVPQTGDYTSDGKIIKPVTGNQYEVGVKGSYFGGRMNTGLALFQISEKNRAVTDPSNNNYYVAQGEARSRGIELTASGEVLPGLTVSGGYTYTAMQIFENSNSVGANYNVTTPKHLFKLWTNYQLPGQWSKWNVGTTFYATSSTYFPDGDMQMTAPGYMTMDTNVGYQVNKHLSATLSVTNLFDRRYIETAAGAGGNYYGAPAKVLLTLHYAM